MKKKINHLISLVMITTLLAAGCSSNQNSKTLTEDAAVTKAPTSGEQETTTSNFDEVLTLASSVVIDKEYKAKDLEVGYDDSTATHITFNESSIEISGGGADSDGTILTIHEEGTYCITGTLADGQILVDAGETDKIQIVLNGASVHNADSAPVYIKNADKVYLTLAEGTENTLTDGTEYIQTDDNTVDGVIFSKADLTINGEGSMNIVASYQHGIVSKDDLVITGGNLNITAVKDAINGKDCVKINDGTLRLSSSSGNGIQSKNGDDNTKGYVYISGGDITVVTSEEGIEGTVVLIEDGKIDITASDDGINAASGKSSTASPDTGTTETEAVAEPMEQPMRRGGFGGRGEFKNDTNCYITIAGGAVSVDASGDGIDSNGSIYISGGTIYVSGPTESGNSALDYNGTAQITGGTVVVAGSAGMAQGFSDTSTQYSVLYNLTSVCEAGSEITLTDSDGKLAVSYTPKKQYQSVVISAPDLKKDGVYTLVCGNQTNEITLSSIVTSNGRTGMNDNMGHGRGSVGRGQMPQGAMPEGSTMVPQDKQG